MRALTVVLSVSLIAPSLAAASPCADAYHATSLEYQARAERLKTSIQDAGLISVGGGGAWLVCVLATPAIVGCSAAVLGLEGITWLRRRSNLRQLERLSQAHAVFSLYEQAQAGSLNGSDLGQNLLQDLGADVRREGEVAARIAQLMDSGALCSQAGAPMVTYPALVNLLKDGSLVF